MEGGNFCNIPYGFAALHGPFMRSLPTLLPDDSEDARKHRFPRQLVDTYRTERDHVKLEVGVIQTVSFLHRPVY